MKKTHSKSYSFGFTQSLCLVFSLICFGQAGAQANSDEITIQADFFEADQNGMQQVYSGNAMLKQNGLEIFADKIVLHIKEGSASKFVATGSPARFKREIGQETPINGQAARMEYDFKREVVLLTSTALLQQGDRQFSGDRIEYNIKTQKTLGVGNDKPVIMKFTLPKADDKQP